MDKWHLNCYPSSSNTWYRVHTRFDDPTITYTCPHGIHLQQRKPKRWLRFLRNLDSEGPRIPIKVVVGVDKWPQLLSQLLSNTWYRVHTRFDDPTITYTCPHGIHLQQRKPKRWLRFLRNLDSEGPRIPIKVVVGVDEPWPQLLSQLFKHLIYGPYKIWWTYNYIHLPPWHPFTTAQTSKCWLRFLRNLDSEGPRIPIKVVVGVDEPWPQLLYELFKHLISGPYKIWWPYNYIHLPPWHPFTTAQT